MFTYGRWWTVLSAGWLHGGALHILFNMIWWRPRAGGRDIYGAARMVIIYTFGSSRLPLTRWRGTTCPCHFGAPGSRSRVRAIFAPWRAVDTADAAEQHVRSEAMGYAITLFVMGLIMSGVDNAAHAGGFIGGYLAGMWLDPLKRERMDHFIGAALCLMATLLAVIWSILSIFL